MKISIGEFSKRAGISVKTLRDWDVEGKLKAEHVPAGKYIRRYYDEEQLKKFLGDTGDKEIKIRFKDGHLRESELDSLSDSELYELLLMVSEVRNSRFSEH